MGLRSDETVRPRTASDPQGHESTRVRLAGCMRVVVVARKLFVTVAIPCHTLHTVWDQPLPFVLCRGASCWHDGHGRWQGVRRSVPAHMGVRCNCTCTLTGCPSHQNFWMNVMLPQRGSQATNTAISLGSSRTT